MSSYMKEALEYAEQFPPQPGVTMEAYAAQLYTLAQESLRSIHGAPYPSFEQLDDVTQAGWVRQARRTARKHMRKP
ncbi:MAG: hypothetical protein ACREQF_02205 [Candidatus Binataceae bacterium]